MASKSLALKGFITAFVLLASFARPIAATTSLLITPDNVSSLQNLDGYPDLEVLTIGCVENLQSLPDAIGTLTTLKALIIDGGNGCSMNPVLPESIGNLHSLEKLVLFGGQDPRGPGEQPKEQHKFPVSMSQLKNLAYLDLGRNGLDEIPSFVKDLPKLQEFGFAWNMDVKEIPSFLTNLHELTTLKLDSDGLTDLPDFLNTMPKLRHITLGNNCAITQNPSKIKELQKRFTKIRIDFEDEYDCPAK